MEIDSQVAGPGHESFEMLSFTFSRALSRSTPRLGSLKFPGRKEILTPGYVATTSRGSAPHITPDIQSKHTDISGVYMPLEDFIEKAPSQTPPVYSIPREEGVSRLRRFTGQPDDALIILGLRRPSPVDAPLHNANDAIAISTSVGFRHEPVDEYIRSALLLEPDIVIGPADLVYVEKKSIKRIEKMCDRTGAWMERLFTTDWQTSEASTILSSQGQSDLLPKFPATFMPVLPLPLEQQSLYLLDMVEFSDRISGLAIYHPFPLSDLPERLTHLPRLSMFPASSPHELLGHIALAIDLFTIPFIAAASDAGIALSFSFPAPSTIDSPAPLGIDLHTPEYASSLDPIGETCTCYACANATRAYMQHLLGAKEMTAWVFLQLHNHAVMDAFFQGVRASIERGQFEEDRRAFERTYVAELPEKTGAGPRVRGYQYRSHGPNEVKRNPPAFRGGMGQPRAEEDVEDALAEAVAPDGGVNAKELEEHGLGKSIA